MEIKFTEPASNWRDNELIVAYYETPDGGKQIAGKHYLKIGLSWNLPTKVRYKATVDEWKDNAVNKRAIY